MHVWRRRRRVNDANVPNGAAIKRLDSGRLRGLFLASQVLGSATPTTGDRERQLIYESMVKNAIVAVNHANLTGNYTVLRDLGSEAFRRRNSAADLAATFARHRQLHYDFSPVLCLAPTFSQSPTEVEPGRLQLIGQFDTRPEVVRFAIVYQHSPAGWALDEVAVALVQAADEAPKDAPK